MKKISLLPALLLVLSLGAVQAQTKKTDKEKTKSNAGVRVNVDDTGDGTHVRVEKEVDGKTEILERTFTDQAAADRFLDSVNAGTGNKMRINVRGDRGAYSYAPGVPRPPKVPAPPRARLYGDNDLAWSTRDREEFKRDMEKFGRDMERWGREYGEKMKNWGQRFEREYRNNWQPEMNLRINRSLDNLNGITFFDGNGTTSSRTVKALNAYPNQPSNGRLNITFQAPEKGDVTIVVTDVEGKEVGREKVKDFFGKYMGQVELKKGAEKGTFFVTVTQGNDGAVKRIVVE
jgi:hypothetical protein